MQQWKDGSIPENREAYYWIMVGTSNPPYTVPQPAWYDGETGAWITFDGTRWSPYAVIAYCEISKPKKRSTVGSGCGYYIKRSHSKEETFFGYGLQPANWCMRGYSTVEKAVRATTRLKKNDIEDGYEETSYEIVDGDGKAVKII